MRELVVHLGIGANLDDPVATLAEAVLALARIPGWNLEQVSPLYRTTPVGLVDQPEFFNAALRVRASLPDEPAAAAVEVLIRVKELERLFGRIPTVRFGPRRLDIDIIAMDDIAVVHPRPLGTEPEGADADRPLVVPHPSATERLFVLAPLTDISPTLKAPGWQGTARELRDAQRRVEGDAAAVCVGAWDNAALRWV
ncbi:MAG: 2-amino-4-hydroxy-6-hydroxymethyldihydropteridine diphosphokinase [Gammaproteobacteria bacterium]|nr:2-amino-4-hydroxy-6-hydroxymethyldihydropteridine diphosphokinase [Gammaproteobacteria bacterium]